MVGDRFFGDGDIFHPTGGAGGFGKIDGLAFPEYIVFAFLDLFDIRFELFVITDGHGLDKFFVNGNLVQVMVFAEFSKS